MTDRNVQRNVFGGSVGISDTGGSQRHRGALRGDQLTLPRAVWDPLIVGVLAAAVSLGGAGRPSFWYDEAATISASYSRSLGQLWQMLSNVDAVHGLYYLLMHGWFQIFPPTEFWSRAPSGLAIGGAAAGLVVLGRQFSSRTVAVASGVVCAILPRATWAAIEARPYALSMMAAVWLTVLLVYAARRDNAAAWLSYGIVLAISILLDVYLGAAVFDSRRFHLCLPAQTKGPGAVRYYVGSGGLRCNAVCSRGRRPSATDQLVSTDRASNDRRCDDSTIFRTKPAVRAVVGAGGSGSYCLVAPHIRATDGSPIGSC